MNVRSDAQQASAAGLGHVDFRLLGPLEAFVHGEPVSLGPPKQRALLVHLALRAGELVPVGRLIDELWPEEPPETARHAIQVYVSRLRKALGDPSRLSARARAYALHLEPGELDLERFRLLVEEARAHLGDEPAAAATRLNEALSLWRGRSLADLDGEPAVRDIVLELEEERLRATELRIEAELATGRDAELVPQLEGLIAEHPAREQLRAQLMLALYRSGRQQDALEAYRRARQALRHELGLEPSPKLKELEAAILRQDPSLIVESSELRARRHLPAQPNAFIGRKRELAEVIDLVASGGVRLVTLTGTGGIGKTRLALAAAERLAPSFRDGVWFVDLAALRDPVLVPRAIAQTLGVKEKLGQAPDAALVEHVRSRELLLVVDNFEHLLEAATVPSELLKAAPRVKLLVTSRAPLNLYGEYEYDVPALEVPDLDGPIDRGAVLRHESVALFVERARAARPNLVVEGRAVESVAEICARLDGLPLAIELAAARLDRLSVDELSTALSRRLEVLTGGPRDVPDRLRTLRAAIGWSYDLLRPEEQQLFARLAVFVGDWTLEAALEICDGVRETLDGLVENGLVRRTKERFAMLETLREFASERLEERGESDEYRQRHALYYTSLAEPLLTDFGEPEKLDRAELEYNNLREALSWCRHAGEIELELRIAAALRRFWFMRGDASEGRMHLEDALRRSANAPPEPRVNAMKGAAMLAYVQGDYSRASALWEDARSILETLGDKAGVAAILVNLALTQPHAYDRAKRLLEESARLCHELGDEAGRCRAVNNLGVNALLRRDHDAARMRFSEALMLARNNGSLEDEAIALTNLGLTELLSDRLQQARSLLHAGLHACREIGDVRMIPNCLEGLSAVAASERDAMRAAVLLGSAESLREAHGSSMEPFFLELHEKTVAAVLALIDEGPYREALAKGKAMAVDEAIDSALEGSSASY